MASLAEQLQKSIATIVRVQKIMEPSVQNVHGEQKLAPPDMQSLRYIAHNPGCPSGTVAQFLGVVPTTMTSIVDRLVNRGLVIRERPADDRRTVALRLSDEGEKIFRQLEAEELAASQRMLDVLEPDEREAFVRSAVRIAEALSRVKT